jgi:hypothetical protein
VWLPNLPTDNLYKYQALSGVTLVLLTFVGLTALVGENERTVAAVEIEEARLEVRANYWAEQARGDSTDKGALSDSDRSQLLEERERIREATAELGAKIGDAHRAVARAKLELWIGLLLILAGIVMAVNGF